MVLGRIESRLDAAALEGQSDEELFATSRTLALRALVSELVWRLPLAVLTFGGLILGGAMASGVRDRAFGSAWLLIAFSLFVVGLLLFRLRSVAACQRAQSLVLLALFAWWGLLPMFGVGTAALWSAALLALIFACGVMPGGRWSNWTAELALFLIFALLLTQPQLMSNGGLLVIAVAALGMLCLPLLHVTLMFGLFARLSQSFVARLCEAFSSVSTTLRVLLWHLCLVSQSDKALLIFEHRAAELVGLRGRQGVGTDNSFTQAIHRLACEREGSEGLLKRSELGEQYLGPLMDWFGRVPGELWYFRLVAVIEEREERVVVLLPVSWEARLIGRAKVQAVLMGLVSLVRVSLGATRSRFLSSDVLLKKERSLSEREEELGSLIHLVNNAAQEISIICESSKEELVKMGSAPVTASADELSSPRMRLFRELEQLEATARILASGVSDVQWLKELARLAESKRLASVELAAVLEELERYGRYRAERKGEEFSLINTVEGERSIQVVNREFLEASLRLLVRLPSQRLTDRKLIRVRVFEDGKMLAIEISDSGALAVGEIKAALGERPLLRGMPGLESYLRGVANMARLSAGSLDVQAGSGEFSNVVTLRLPLVAARKLGQVTAGGWVLLVDDRQEVTTFYARVAEALQLNYSTAATEKEACDLLEQRGQPRLVITDIELQQGSGLDLVRTVRARFGSQLPIVVVSGHNDSDIAERAHDCGATRFLQKPVGRSKLFSEIKELLHT